jgi:hydroxymethylglutaryl-CoA reductase
MGSKSISGFSKLSKSERLQWIRTHFMNIDAAPDRDFEAFWLENHHLQRTLDGFSENTISNFVMPYGVAPNFLIDGELYCVPMVIEESSVVAAASSAAKYWLNKGGFRTTILGTTKVGQVHFVWHGEPEVLAQCFDKIKTQLIDDAKIHTVNMENRGGGILTIDLIDFTADEPGLYQIRAHFDTKDSMGANFINTVLECFANSLQVFFQVSPSISDDQRDVEIIMSILSNYTPECIVRAEVSCPVEDLAKPTHRHEAVTLANKFKMAVNIAHIDPYRATTHNKGIFNGIDAVILATGNDFRAVEAAGHSYAARQGRYQSLSHCEIIDGLFRFWMDIPLAIGTVGGLTSLHPLAKLSLEMLGQPDAERLMRIVASVGLAQNFAALKSLVTTGIQHGHMKMHIVNILNHLQASDIEIAQTCQYFEDKTVSFAAVRDYHALLSTK